jgi:hypothetical protein
MCNVWLLLHSAGDSHPCPMHLHFAGHAAAARPGACLGTGAGHQHGLPQPGRVKTTSSTAALPSCCLQEHGGGPQPQGSLYSGVAESPRATPPLLHTAWAAVAAGLQPAFAQ